MLKMCRLWEALTEDGQIRMMNVCCSTGQICRMLHNPGVPFFFLVKNFAGHREFKQYLFLAKVAHAVEPPLCKAPVVDINLCS